MVLAYPYSCPSDMLLFSIYVCGCWPCSFFPLQDPCLLVELGVQSLCLLYGGFHAHTVSATSGPVAMTTAMLGQGFVCACQRWPFQALAVRTIAGLPPLSGSRDGYFKTLFSESECDSHVNVKCICGGSKMLHFMSIILQYAWFI